MFNLWRKVVLCMSYLIWYFRHVIHRISICQEDRNLTFCPCKWKFQKTRSELTLSKKDKGPVFFRENKWKIIWNSNISLIKPPGGTLANSLALISDATHLASDLSGFLVSLFAISVAARPPTAKLSFGFYRAGEKFRHLMRIIMIYTQIINICNIKYLYLMAMMYWISTISNKKKGRRTRKLYNHTRSIVIVR